MSMVVADVPRITAVSIDILTAFFWIYLVVVLKRNKHKLLFVKRGTILLQAYVFVSFVHVVFFEPAFIVVKSSFVPEYIEAYLSYIASGAFHITFEITHTIFALRFLLHYAKIKRSESIDKQDEENKNLSFIVKYHNIFGNPSKLFTICLIVTLIQLCMIITVTLSLGFPYNRENEVTTNRLISRLLLPFWFVRIVVIIYCFIKLRKFEDYWLITQEFKYLMMSILIVTCFYILMLFSIQIVSTNTSLTVNGSVIVLTYSAVVMFSIWSLATAYISVIWVNKMDDKLFKNRPQNKNVDSMSQNPTTTSTRPICIFDVLTNKQCMSLTCLSFWLFVVLLCWCVVLFWCCLQRLYLFFASYILYTTYIRLYQVFKSLSKRILF